MHEVYAVRFSAKKIVKHFGGATATYKAMIEAGSSIREKTVQKWTERGVIPADAVASLMLTAQKRNKDFDPYEFIVIDEEPLNE